MPAEHDLLRWSSRPLIDRLSAEHVHALLRGSIDWQYLSDLGVRHGVTPLVFKTLISTAADLVPADVDERLLEHSVAVARRNAQLARRLTEILHVLETAGIRALAFKGPVLAAAAYGDIALREFADLDLLVSGDDFSAAREALLTRGFRVAEDHGWETHFAGEDRVAIDLHRGLTPSAFPMPIDFGRLWQRRQSVDMDGNGLVATALSSEDMLLVLAIEAARDCWEGKLKLLRVCDIGWILSRGPRLHWDVVDREARCLRARRMLVFGVELAIALLRIPIAEDARRVIRTDRAMRSLVADECAAFFAAHGAAATAGTARTHLHFRLREHLRDRIAPLLVGGWRRLLTPNARDRAVVALPRWLSPLYYLIRPIRLAWHYCRLRP